MIGASRLSWALVGAIVLLGTIASACHRMRPLSRAQLNPADLPPRIWVTGLDRSVVILDVPRIRGDTLGGWVSGEYREMALSQTTAIRAREPAPGRTALLATVTSVTALGVFILMESRKDVGNAKVCLNASDHIPAPFTPCCFTDDTIPC